MASILLSFSGLPASQNSRRHHMARWREDQRWKDEARLLTIDAINRSPHKDFPWPRVHVTYLFHYPRRTSTDPDNKVGSMKPCLDGVKGLAFPDDSVKYIHDLSVRVSVVKGTPAGVDMLIQRCECSSEA